MITSIAFGKSTLHRVCPEQCITNLSRHCCLSMYIWAGTWVSLMLHSSPWVYVRFPWHQMIMQAWSKGPCWLSEVTQTSGFFYQCMLGCILIAVRGSVGCTWR